MAIAVAVPVTVVGRWQGAALGNGVVQALTDLADRAAHAEGGHALRVTWLVVDAVLALVAGDPLLDERPEGRAPEDEDERQQRRDEHVEREGMDEHDPLPGRHDAEGPPERPHVEVRLGA